MADENRPGILTNLALMSCALLVTLAALEIGVRLLVDLRSHRPIRVEDVNLDTRLSFLPNRTRTYETDEFRITITTNAHGRRDAEWTKEMFEDPDNLVFIGDSFVLGSAVEEPNSIPARIQTLESAAGRTREVFNFGIPAASPREYMLNLKEAIGMGIRARTVVVGVFVGNDFDPNYLPRPETAQSSAEQRETQHPGLLAHSHLARFIRWRVAHSTRLVGLMLWLSDWTGIRLYTTPAAYIFFRQQTPDQVAAFRGMLGYIGEMDEICRANGRQLSVVIIPNKIQVENRESLTGDSYEAEKPNRLILEYCSEREISCLDLLPVLSGAYERSGEPLYFSIDRHLNERGYRIAAEAIHDFLVPRIAPAGE